LASTQQSLESSQTTSLHQEHIFLIRIGGIIAITINLEVDSMSPKLRKALLWISGMLGGLILLLLFLARPSSTHPFFTYLPDHPLVIAHRGGSNLWPENTMVGFRAAVEMGVDLLEMDIHSSADGVLVVIHDDSVDRTTDGSGLVNQLSLTQLKSLDAGYQWSSDEGLSFPFRGQGVNIPTLEEVFKELRGYPMNIEIKQAEPSITEPFCQMIRAYGMQERVLVASFDPGTLADFRRTCPEVATSTTSTEVRILYFLSQSGLGALYRPPAQAVQVPEFSGNFHVLNEKFIKSTHRKNLQVHAYTINTVDDMRRLLDSSLDGLITDYPDQMQTLINH
jgi:glycerophosphoryl diester phosphodiesterase